MLLRRVERRLWKRVVDLASDVALEASDDLSLREALGGATLDVGPCLLVAVVAVRGPTTPSLHYLLGDQVGSTSLAC